MPRFDHSQDPSFAPPPSRPITKLDGSVIGRNPTVRSASLKFWLQIESPGESLKPTLHRFTHIGRPGKPDKSRKSRHGTTLSIAIESAGFG